MSSTSVVRRRTTLIRLVRESRWSVVTVPTGHSPSCPALRRPRLETRPAKSQFNGAVQRWLSLQWSPQSVVPRVLLPPVWLPLLPSFQASKLCLLVSSSPSSQPSHGSEAPPSPSPQRAPHLFFSAPPLPRCPSPAARRRRNGPAISSSSLRYEIRAASSLAPAPRCPPQARTGRRRRPTGR